MTLGQQQRIFSFHVAKLILHAYELGYEVSLGEAFRPKDWAKIMAKRGKGIKNSLHCDKLAIDLNLFIDGKYQASTRAHRRLGLWWEKQHILCRWGGRFKDGNHYSMIRGGRR